MIRDNSADLREVTIQREDVCHTLRTVPGTRQAPQKYSCVGAPGAAEAREGKAYFLRSMTPRASVFLFLEGVTLPSFTCAFKPTDTSAPAVWQGLSC